MGGFIEEKLYDGNNIYYDMISLYDGQSGNIIGLSNKVQNKAIPFTKIFEGKGVDILKNSLEYRKLLIMDELGFLESNSYNFQKYIKFILDSNTPVLGVLKSSNCEFINSIANRKDVILLEVTKENRSSLKDNIVNIITKYGIPLKKNNFFYFNKEFVKLYDEALYNKNNTYPKLYIDEIRSYIKNFSNLEILDVGAGTGAFSIPIANEGGKVYAVDSSFNMLETFKERAKKENLNNIHYFLGPFEHIPLTTYDICICAYCQDIFSTGKSLNKFLSSFKRYGFIIVPMNKYDRNFDCNELMLKLNRNLKKHNIDGNDIISTLSLMNIKFQYKNIKASLHQYFKNFNDALNFLCFHFNIKLENEIIVTENFLRSRLIQTSNGYILPNTKNSTIITIIG